MKKIVTFVITAILLFGCAEAQETISVDKEMPEEAAEEVMTPTPSVSASPTPAPTPGPTSTASPTPTPSATPKSVATPVSSPAAESAEVSVQQEQSDQYASEPVQEYSEPVWEEPAYYEEPVQEPVYTDNSVASQYNGQYAGTSCEGVAGLYLGGDMSYLLASYGYQVWDPIPGDVIAYFDSGWNYRHTAVFLGGGQALHGSYNADKSAQVASMYIGGYPNLCYYRIGGDTCYTQFLNDVAHNGGGTAGWLEGITFPLG